MHIGPLWVNELIREGRTGSDICPGCSTMSPVLVPKYPEGVEGPKGTLSQYWDIGDKGENGGKIVTAFTVFLSQLMSPGGQVDI